MKRKKWATPELKRAEIESFINSLKPYMSWKSVILCVRINKFSFGKIVSKESIKIMNELTDWWED